MASAVQFCSYSILICFYNLHSNLRISIILCQFHSTILILLYTYLISISHWIYFMIYYMILSAVQYQFYSLHICYSHFRSPRIPYYRRTTTVSASTIFSIYRQSTSTIFQFQCRSFVLNFINYKCNETYSALNRHRARKKNRESDRASIEKALSFQTRKRSRVLFMEVADSDKDSKSSELTIGPSCIQFRLIIVKVEKFQSAVSEPILAAFSTLQPAPSFAVVSHSILKRANVSFSSSAFCFRVRFYEFRTSFARYRTFASL